MTPGDGPVFPGPPPSTARAGGGKIADSGRSTGYSPGLPAVVLAALSLTSFILITIVPLGATRVFSWPWSVAYLIALTGPAGVLLLRAFNRESPLALPPGLWRWLPLAGAAVLLFSALASPHRSASLLWAAPGLAALAAFLVLYDWLQAAPANSAARRDAMKRAILWICLLIAVASLATWLSRLGEGHSLLRLLRSRNPFPLGHSSYTAGLAILMLPWLVAFAWRHSGLRRFVAVSTAVLALAMLFTSGSRGGMLALAGAAALGLVAAPLRTRAKLWIGLGAVLFASVLVLANPRTRAMLAAPAADAPPNISNVQREAMLVAAFRMGRDRPLLGWGPGTTPLVYPRYRAGLDGGAETVLQLHSLPAHLWAELGAAGLLCAVIGGALVWRRARHDAAAAVAVGGYAVFSLFDAQLDVPVFGAGLAAFAALLAPPPAPAGRNHAPVIGALASVAFAVVVVFGHRDRAAILNVAALDDQHGRSQPAQARALLEESLALNVDQEIAHFNLGWLLLIDDPTRAAQHFTAAARLVPDKGGVYFGLGLARLNAGNQSAAAQALALELLNDPVFVLSPWWNNPHFQALRPAALAQLSANEERLTRTLAPNSWPARELRYLQALRAWVTGTGDATAVAAVANTPARREFFRGNPSPAVIHEIGTRTVRRQRVGYPVLMRNLDLAAPYDLWVIPESAVRGSKLEYLWPDKGWLASPLLLALLETPDSTRTLAAGQNTPSSNVPRP